MTGSFAVTHCQRCASELTYQEYKAMSWYCEKCAKVRADDRHREELGQHIETANRRAK